MDSEIDGKYDYKDINYNDSPELDYYKLDAFNQSNNLPDAYYIQNPKK